MSKVSRHSQETFTLTCGNVDKLLPARPTNFGAEIHLNAMNE